MRYLFVVAHPDDESNSCGATIHKLTSRDGGCAVAVCIMSGQASARRFLSNTLFQDMNDALSILKVNKKYVANFPDMKTNVVPRLELVQFIEASIEDFQADAIITHHPADVNNTHVTTSYAAQAAVRLFQRKSGICPLKLFAYMESPSVTDWALDSSRHRFMPNCYVEVRKENLAAKIEALKCYKGVMRNYPHPRSIKVYESLAAYRGSQAGVNYAEAYECVFQRI